MATRDPGFDKDYIEGDGWVYWTTALDYIAKLNQENYLGYNDWRLPNIHELMSLLDLGAADTVFTHNHPFKNIQKAYWSSTSMFDKMLTYGMVMYKWEFSENTRFWPGQVLFYHKVFTINDYVDMAEIHILPVRGNTVDGLIELPRTFQEDSYYPGDDKDLSMGVPWPIPRFLDHNDSTITDRITGLMWTQNAEPLRLFGFGWGDLLNWDQAFAYLDSLNNKNYCGYNDWRLPNRHEMLSLRDFGGEYLNTYLPKDHPFTRPAGSYWTSTTSASLTENAHAVNITLIDATLELPKEDPTLTRIWPVRTDNTASSPGSIQGKIMRQGNPLKDVKLYIEGPVNATVSSDANGDYKFEHLPPGSYLITPSKIYYSFNPQNVTVNLSTEDETRNFSAALTATHGWQNLRNNLPETFGMRDMHFIGQEGWLVGGCDRVYYTPDGGMSFQIQYLPENSGISNSVFMKSNKEGYVVTGKGHIIKTDDGGLNWYLLHAPGNVLNSVHFPPASNTGFTCGINGTVWSFDDTSITDVSTPTVSHLKSICFPEDVNEGKVLGETYIGRYKDNTWNNLQFYDWTYGGFNSIFFIDNTTGWCVGLYGTLFYTVDGIEWLFSQISGIYDNSLEDIFFINSTEGWVVGSEVIWHSVDGGFNWTDDAPGFADGMSLSTVYFISSEEGYAGGNDVFLKYGPLVSGISEQHHTEIFDVRVFPNPARKEFSVSSPEFRVEDCTIELYDLNGRKLLSKNIRKGNETVGMDVSSLKSGIYLCKVSTEKYSVTKKIIIQK